MRTLEVYEKTDVYARLFFRNILSDVMIKPEEDKHHKFSYNPEYYITVKQADDFLQKMIPVESNPDHDEIRNRLFQLIANSGIVNLAIDEYHMPPLAELQLEGEIIEMIRYAMAVFSYRNYEHVTKEDIASLINGNLDEFCFCNHNVFEGLKIKNETIDKIFDYISFYFITD
jgi:hypothetical protein